MDKSLAITLNVGYRSTMRSEVSELINLVKSRDVLLASANGVVTMEGCG